MLDNSKELSKIKNIMSVLQPERFISGTGNDLEIN